MVCLLNLNGIALLTICRYPTGRQKSFICFLVESVTSRLQESSVSPYRQFVHTFSESMLALMFPIEHRLS